ncbi:hypothetical protein QTP86_005166 [Hemibagrus guttatus]|nr:hypothetical protein QTP86_005166 [Hemibagrus guttatus]
MPDCVPDAETVRAAAMDLDEIDGLNDACPAVYRAALKLRSLQKLCHTGASLRRANLLDMCSREEWCFRGQALALALALRLCRRVVTHSPRCEGSNAGIGVHMVLIQDLRSALWAVDDSGNISQENLKQSLEQLFQGVLQKLPVQVVPEATEQTARLLFKLYDREKTGFVHLRSVEAALIVLTGDTLSAKHRALFQLAVSCSRRQGTEDTFVSRAGLRNLLDDLSQVPAVVQESHVFGPVEAAIQSCFTGVISGRTGEENFVSWLQSEPHLLLWLSTLYRLSVSEAVQHRVRCHACKAFPITGLSCTLSLSDQECVDNMEGLDIIVSENVPPPPTPPPAPQLNMESKSLQTDESDAQPQRKMSLLQKDLSITQTAMEDLQRDKGLLEKEFQVWKVAAQSEHDSLEDRCKELEATMGVLIQHNQQLEQELGQVRHTLSMRGRDEFGSDISTPPPQQHDRDNTKENQFTEPECPASCTTTEKDQEIVPGESRGTEQQMEEEDEEKDEEEEEEEEETLNQVQEERHTDVVVTETCVTETKEEVQQHVGETDEEEEEEEEKEEEPHLYRQELIRNDTTLYRPVEVEDSGKDNSNEEEEEEEEELCDLVERLHSALLSTPTGKCSG